jgi:hypothetical protein
VSWAKQRRTVNERGQTAREQSRTSEETCGGERRTAGGREIKEVVVKTRER